jgi:hypothetical protein
MVVMPASLKPGSACMAARKWAKKTGLGYIYLMWCRGISWAVVEASLCASSTVWRQVSGSSPEETEVDPAGTPNEDTPILRVYTPLGRCTMGLFGFVVYDFGCVLVHRTPASHAVAGCSGSAVSFGVFGSVLVDRPPAVAGCSGSAGGGGGRAWPCSAVARTATTLCYTPPAS